MMGYPPMKGLKALVEKERKNLEKTGIPRCCICKKPMKMGIDSITKKRSKYVWEFQCKCHPTGIRLCIG